MSQTRTDLQGTVTASSDGKTVTFTTERTATAEQMAKTFPYILTSGALNDRVMRELGISAMPAVSASVLNNTNIFTLTVTSSDPQLAYNVLNAVIENYPDVAEFVVGPTVMNLLDESGLPSVPYNTRSYRGAVKKSVLVCTALWLLVCIVFAALRSTVHGEDELKQILNLPTLGVLPLVRSRKKSERALCLQPEAHSGFSEAVQLMRIRVQKKMRESGMKVLLVSSASPGEGKTTVAINLAEALAGGGARVLLVDCDLRNPSVARALGLENKDGLAEYLRGETSYQKIVRQAQTKGLYLVLAGKPDANAAELLTRPACRPFFDACRTVCPSRVISWAWVRLDRSRTPSTTQATTAMRMTQNAGFLYDSTERMRCLGFSSPKARGTAWGKLGLWPKCRSAAA